MSPTPFTAVSHAGETWGRQKSCQEHMGGLCWVTLHVYITSAGLLKRKLHAPRVSPRAVSRGGENGLPPKSPQSIARVIKSKQRVVSNISRPRKQ